MIYELLNCSFVDGVDPLPDAQDGDEFWLCKMAQRNKGTPLFTGKKIKIIGGDWSNVKQDDNFACDIHAVFTEFDWIQTEKEPINPRQPENQDMRPK